MQVSKMNDVISTMGWHTSVWAMLDNGQSRADIVFVVSACEDELWGRVHSRVHASDASLFHCTTLRRLSGCAILWVGP